MNYPAWMPELIDTALILVSVLSRGIVTILIGYGLYRFNEGLELPERIGMGLIGGSAFMTIPVVFDISNHGTPFDIWAGTLSAIGILTFILGRLRRLRRHAVRNQAMIDAALVWAADKKRKAQT